MQTLMPFEWTDQTLRWYAAASEFTGFHQRLASLVAPLLADCPRIADLGAGLGLLDMALAEHHGEQFPTILAMDVDPLPLVWCEAEKRRRQLTMPLTLQSDCRTLAGEWDGVICSFFGYEFLANYLPHCRRLVVICNDDGAKHFASDLPRQRQRDNVSNISSLLAEQGAQFQLQRLEAQFGQPLTARQELAPYLAAMHSDSPLSLAEAEARLEQTGDQRYPYYLPHLKHVAIFSISGQLG